MSSATVRSYSPQAPDHLVGEFPAAGAEEVTRAIASARIAQREWWAAGAAARAGALTAAASGLRDRAAEAASLIVTEVGKPVGEATAEVGRAVAILDYYAQSCFAAIGEHYPPSLGGLLYSERRPWGVAGLITPWNFPLAIPLWKAAPALACGNAVVLKPSPQAAACAAFLSALLQEHLPDNLFTVLQGESEAGSAVLAGADIVSFTGSDTVGRIVAAQAGTRSIPAQCEMGGQNAAIVLPDADPEITAAQISAAAMGFAGQKCTATRRVIVVGAADAFLDALVAATGAMRAQPPEQPGSVLGPVISEAARERVLAATAQARSDGGRQLAGADKAEGEGWFVAPTLIAGLAPDHPLAREETFGPLALVLSARDVAEAVAISNAVRYGLVTSIHTNDSDAALAAVAGLDAGLIKVNGPTTGVDFYAPFGGEKDSSYGPREQGPQALAFYSATRTVSLAPHRP